MDTLVLLHGFCEDSSVWAGLLPFLSSLPVQCLDLPGFGQSPSPAQPTMSAYAEAIRQTLLAQGVSRCVLAGHSLGGYVTLEFASRWPDMLAGVGLLHSHPYADTAERREARDRGIALLRGGKKDAYVAELFPGLFAKCYAERLPEVVQKLIANGRQQSAEGIIAALEAMKERPDHQDTLSGLACPALFVLGSEDSLIPVEDGLRAATLPDVAEVEVLEGVAHMGMFEAPQEVAGVLKGFWATCVGKTGTFVGGL
ncbi:MAG TPA: alpha/beta hydrolase [Saprospiraceae bacterium]|nr:alpha/beta hydrolase [Saprospiraceae bacterium]HND88696.1 alpha/beta hydrolase [Saprospiraceae bacterium]